MGKDHATSPMRFLAENLHTFVNSVNSSAADSMTLDDAISSGDCARMKDVLAGMSELEAQNQVQRCCRIPKDEQESALIQQAREGNVAMLLAVLTELWQRCTVQEVRIPQLGTPNAVYSRYRFSCTTLSAASSTKPITSPESQSS